MSSPSPGQAVHNLADSDPLPCQSPVVVERVPLGYLPLPRRRLVAVLAGLGLLLLALLLYALATLARR